MDIEITYIWHDCFLVRMDGIAIVTDYWREAPAEGHRDISSPSFLDELPPETPLYVLVSHHHKDHFNRHIFSWVSRFKNIHYILSRDTAKAVRYLLRPDSTYSGALKVDPALVTVLDEGESYADSRLSIRAYGSTDIGNSYMVECDGYTLFHAGDLNAWIWKDESSEEEVSQALDAFKKIVKSIARDYPEVDVAMFPVDSRLGTDYWEGASIFVRMIDVRYFLPMHFTLADTPENLGERIADAIDFKSYRNQDKGEYVALTRPGQAVTLKL